MGNQDRLVWRDSTCPAHTLLIMSWKFLLLLYCYHLLLLLLLLLSWETKTSVLVQVTPALAVPVEPAALRAQTDAEARRDMEAMASFSGRVKEWWQDFSHDTLSQRQEGSLRLTCEGEDGLLRPCCGFVKPLQLGRLAAKSLRSLPVLSMHYILLL